MIFTIEHILIDKFDLVSLHLIPDISSDKSSESDDNGLVLWLNLNALTINF